MGMVQAALAVQVLYPGLMSTFLPQVVRVELNTAQVTVVVPVLATRAARLQGLMVVVIGTQAQAVVRLKQVEETLRRVVLDTCGLLIPRTMVAAAVAVLLPVEALLAALAVAVMAATALTHHFQQTVLMD
tara:strand:+ start:574 stop:963 length:390 start_codon:yes stop_codon:yes gene_type:complete